MRDMLAQASEEIYLNKFDPKVFLARDIFNW
jgi:hypothetical protein